MLSERSTRTLSIILFVSLLLAGIVTYVAFAGVEEHFKYLLPRDPADGRIQAVLSACDGDGIFCRGVHALLPTLLYAFERSAPFLGYIIFSLLALGLWLGGRAVMSQSADEPPRLKVWTLPLLFLASIWLMFTMIMGADLGRGAPLKRMIDPAVPEYAQQVDAKSLLIIRESFNNLRERGCLKAVPNSTVLYDLSGSCAQQSFFTLVLPLFLFILLVAADFLLLGNALLSWLRLRPRHGLTLGRELLLSLGLGVGGVVAVLWLLSVFGIIIPPLAWVLVLGIPVLCYRQAIRFWGIARETSLEFPSRFGGWPLIIGWALFGLLALNFLSVIRPFPIGWDDLGSYLNRPHLLAEYGQFIPKMATFQWEFVTSLGFLLFGTKSAFGAAAAMLLNWLAGVFAIFGIIGTARVVLRGGGLITGFFYYLLPMVGHFSFADMKIDNAVFLMSTLGFICVFAALFPEHHHDEEGEDPTDRRRWLLLAGLFTGLALGFKVTSAMTLFGLLLVLAGVGLGPLAAFAVAFVMPAAFALQGTFKPSEFLSRFFAADIVVPTLAVVGICLAVAAACGVLAAMRRPTRWRPTLKELGLFIVGILATVLPWVVHNNIYNRQWPPRTIFNIENRLAPEISLDSKAYSTTRLVKTLPPELALDINHPACQSTGTIEELDRYWGTSSGPGHYLFLPWRTVMNLDNGGYYVTTSPLLLLLPFLLLFPVFWLPAGRRLRWVMILTVVQVAQWMVLANGVLWYGLGMFIGIALLVEAMLREAPDRPTRLLVGTLITLSMLTSWSFRLWQFEMQGGSLEYVIGKVSEEVIYAQTIPQYLDVAEMVTQRAEAIPDRPYTLRMGTFIPYFIPRNLERIPIADNQLDFFTCVSQGDDFATITKRLRAYGFNGIIFDFNTATIEADPNGTLHKKVERFLNYASDPASGLQAFVIDPTSGVGYFLIP